MSDSAPDFARKAMATQALFDAVLAKDIAKAKEAIDDGANVNGNDVDRPLPAAVLMGNTEMTRLLLSRGADPERETRSDVRCFFHAIETTRIDLVELMLEYGVSPTNPNSSGQTPLHIAAEGCNEDVMRLLIDRGCGVNDLDPVGRSPAYVAASSGNSTALRFLLREGADPESKPHGYPSAQRKAEEGGNHHCIFLLIAYGGKDAEDLEGDFTQVSPLEACVACGDIERFAELLDQQDELVADELETLRSVCESVERNEPGGGQMTALLNAWVAAKTMRQIASLNRGASTPGL